MKMQKKIFLTFLLVIALPTLGFCIVLLEICGGLIEDRTLDASVVVVQESIKRIENRLDDYRRMTMQIYYNEELMHSLAARSEANGGEQPGQSFREIFKSFVNTDRHLVTVSLHTAGSTLVEGTDIIGLSSLVKAHGERAEAVPGRLIWIPTTPLSTVFGLDSRYFGAMRLLRKDGKPLGTLLLLIREDFFLDKEAGELPYKGSRDLILTSSGRVVYASEEDRIGSSFTAPYADRVLSSPEGHFLSDDREHYIVYRRSDLTGWTFIRILERDAVLRHFSSLKEGLFLLIGFFILFLISLSYYFSTGLAKPLAEMTRQVDFFGDGNLFFSFSGLGRQTSEVKRLSESIEAMAGRIHLLIEKVAEEQEQKTTAELKALRSQLNPHFIYNTLNTIRWMAAVNRQTNIEETVRALITLIQSASDMDRVVLPLKEELDVLHQYVLIQKRRFHDFHFKVDVPEEVLGAHINKFIIQPFVENSLIHGFSERDEAGTIRVAACRVELPESRRRLEITIEDDGCGFEVLPGGSSQERGSDLLAHTGIRNVRRRLQLNYGAHQELTIRSVPGKGTRVFLSIPWSEEGGESSV